MITALTNKTKQLLLWERKREKMIFSMFEDELAQIDKRILSCTNDEIPQLFKKIPLDVFGELLLDAPTNYPNIKSFFPDMVSNEVQAKWTGSHGDSLLQTSLAFIKTMAYGYVTLTGKNIENAKVLDYGCGWGRLIRLLYKLTPIENIYGVDPWDKSIEECIRHRLKGNIKKSDWVPESLPFTEKFNLIFAFSVFTHLSPNTASTALRTLSNYIEPDGILVITIRPKEYWQFHEGGKLSAAMLKAHEETGYAFAPHKNRWVVNGEITYGDASISLDYLRENFPNWRVAQIEQNKVDLYQTVVFLRPT